VSLDGLSHWLTACRWDNYVQGCRKPGGTPGFSRQWSLFIKKYATHSFWWCKNKNSPVLFGQGEGKKTKETPGVFWVI